MSNKSNETAIDKKTAKSKKSTLEKVRSTILTLMLIVVIVMAILLAGVRIFGFTPYAILSGSMTPTYKVGDLVYVKETAPEDIEVGEAITFVLDEDLTVVTHRVVDADRDEGYFITQGDANQAVDGSPVLYKNVLGTVRFSLPKLGYISFFMSSTSGRYIGLAVLSAIILLALIPALFKKSDDDEEKISA